MRKVPEAPMIVNATEEDILHVPSGLHRERASVAQVIICVFLGVALLGFTFIPEDLNQEQAQ